MGRRKQYDPAARAVLVQLTPEDIDRMRALAAARGQPQGQVIGEALKLLAAACAWKSRGGEVVFLEHSAREQIVKELILRREHGD